MLSLATDRYVATVPTSSRRRASLRLAALVAVVMTLAGGPGFAGGQGGAAETAPATAPLPRAAREATPRRLTKFEARKIRHACYGRANEKNLIGAEREAFLTRCYFGRVSYRAERQQCRQQAAAQNIDKSVLRDFLRECVRERRR